MEADFNDTMCSSELRQSQSPFSIKEMGRKAADNFLLLFFMGGEFVFKLKMEKKHLKRQKQSNVN